ncbi:hypothetical protein [Devosia alba]|uniref:hypothetical protein n=1 Tax=Devosia alba TaxID=3152360 RepID=UPI0032648DEA
MIHIISSVVNEAFGVAQVEGPKKYDYSSGILAARRISVAAARCPGRTCQNYSQNIYVSRIFSSILDANPQADRRVSGQVQTGQAAEPGAPRLAHYRSFALFLHDPDSPCAHD